MSQVLACVSAFKTDTLGFTLFSPTYQLSIFCNGKQWLVGCAERK
jgi:hypothetical protein